jgi:hypothetical protein
MVYPILGDIFRLNIPRARVKQRMWRMRIRLLRICLLCVVVNSEILLKQIFTTHKKSKSGIVNISWDENLGAEILIMGPFTITMMVTQSMALVNA